MLKLLSNSPLRSRMHNLAPGLRTGPETSSPLAAVISHLRGLGLMNVNLSRPALFCSDSKDGPAQEAEVQVKAAEDAAEDTESKASSAIVPTNPRPEDYLTVLALPLPHRPLFPGFYMPIYVKDPKLLSALQESRKRQAPYAGAFLLKDEPGTDPRLVSGSETEKNTYDLKGKDLFNRLHEVGTLAQISSIRGDQVVLIGHRRLQITEMVSEDPMTVKVDHLKDKPYNKDADFIKATSFEVISTLRDVLNTRSLWRDNGQTFTQHIGDFNFPRLADFGAAISGANKLQSQLVLEELDVNNRLKLTLELWKKEMEISKIQEPGLETDDNTALSGKFRERLEPNREKCPPHVLQAITKLQLLDANSSEFNVTCNYLDWLIALPWGNYSDENFDIFHAQKILDEDHYGLSDWKERIMEFIAVKKLRGISQATTPALHELGIPEILELIDKQHWSNLKSHLKLTNPTALLHQLLTSGNVNPMIVLRYFKWSQKELNVKHGLQFSCRLLILLVNAEKHSQVRSFLDWFVKSEDNYKNFCIFHTLLMCSDRFCAVSIILDMLMLAYVRNMKTNLGFEVFKRAGDYGFKSSALSCNPLLSCLVKENEIKRMEFVYKEMMRRRIQPNLITFNIVINGLCKVGKLNKAGDIKDDMKAWGFMPNVITYNTLIHGYCKMGRAGKMHKADALLREMVSFQISPNERTFNILIDGFCKDDNISGAMKLFEEMRSQGLKPNAITYNSMITGLCNGERLNEAQALRDEMIGADVKPNIVTYNALINGFCKKKKLEEAQELLEIIEQNGLAPNVRTFNTLIDAYCKDGKLEEAFQLRSLMLGRGIIPDVSTYNCFVSGFCKENNMEGAKQIVNAMKERGLKADVVTYNILIHGLCKKRESRRAARLLDEMLRSGISPMQLTYNTLMDGYCREGNLRAALNVKVKMEKEGRRANIATYNVLIKGYCAKGKLEDANRFLNEMMEKGLIPNRTTYEIVKEEMLEKGFLPDIEGHLYQLSASTKPIK